MEMGVPFSFTLLLCFWYSTSHVDGGLEHTCYLNDRVPYKGGICGSMANRVLDMICTTGKRSVNYIDGELNPGKRRNLMKVSTPKRTALSYLSKRSDIQGFTCECCYNRCSVTELREYCHDN